MQDLQGVGPTKFLAAGQEPLIKFEINVDGAWVNLSNVLEHVVDGGFEQWLDGTDLKDWIEYINPAGVSTINRESSIVHGGTYSLRFYIDPAKKSVSVTQNITLIPGNAYLLTFWYKGSVSPGTLLHLSLICDGNNKWLDSSGDWESMDIYDGGFTRSNTTIWTLCSVAFNAEDSYADYTLKVRSCTHGGGVADAQIYVDDLSIVETGLGAGVSGNYLESAGISLGGASMTPNPVEGVWNATIFNKDGIFHPQNQDSALIDYFKTQRLSRISIGAKYDDVDYYWPRIIGYMDVPNYSIPDFKVAISGGDYMKFLKETEFKIPDNYWGATTTFPAIDSSGEIGNQRYIEEDAMDTEDDGTGDYNNVDDWTPTHCIFIPLKDAGDAEKSTVYVGQMVPEEDKGWYSVNDPDVMDVQAEVGKEYQVKFEHRAVTLVAGGVEGQQAMRVHIHQAAGICKEMLYYPTTVWKEESFTFTALADGAVQMRIIAAFTIADLRIDNISIFEFKSYWSRYYDLRAFDADEEGIHHVTIDSGAGEVAVWQGEEDEGWWYEESTGHLFFDINRNMTGGDTIKVYYFKATAPETAVEDILLLAGVPTATDLDFDATGITINKIWFEEGTTCLNAIKMLCERGDNAATPYRFHFKYDGIPVFKPKPAFADPVDFTFTDPGHIESINTYQDSSEIKNRIIIKGFKQAEPVSKEETRPSELRDEDSDADSITAYGERTLTINNYLFQELEPITAMCVSLKDEYKDPKWYSDLTIPFNPVPIEMGDTIQWEERLSPTLNIIPSPIGLVRDIKMDNFNTIYKCEIKP